MGLQGHGAVRWAVVATTGWGCGDTMWVSKRQHLPDPIASAAWGLRPRLTHPLDGAWSPELLHACQHVTLRQVSSKRVQADGHSGPGDSGTTGAE